MNSDNKSSANRSSFNVNNKAAKFMNSVMTKSSSFRRALFPKSAQLTSNSNSKKSENPPLMITLASGSEISTTSDQLNNATESSLNSKSALIQPHTSSDLPKLQDLPETAIILENNEITTNSIRNSQSNLESLTSII